MFSENGELIFIVNKFKFSYHKILQNEFKRFKCTKRGCTAYLRICKNKNVVWESSNLNHSHNPDEENQLERQIISNGLKRKAIESICERPSKLLHSYLRENSINSITTQDVKYIKYNMLQAQALVHPKLPKNIQEMNDILQTMDIKTYDNPQSVGDCFSFKLAEIQPNNEQIIKFMDYLIENYIENNSLFPPHIWAEKSSSVSRTTYSCESFHSKFNSQFSSLHLNIYSFLDVLYGIQADTEIIIRSSNVERPHKKKFKKKFNL
ncbi:hypothetical protein QTP88_016463 [Uroleucon formosanum]